MSGSIRTTTRPRVGYLVSHPIQYQAPLLRLLAQRAELDLEVVFLSDYSASDHFDPGFGTSIAWDVPLTEGYANRALTALPVVDFYSPFLPDIWHRIGGDRLDALWVHGWNQATQLVAVAEALRHDVPVLLRGESKLEARGTLRTAALKALAGRASACLAIGEENREFYAGMGVPPERIIPAPYGVDNAYFEERARSARATRAETARSLGIDPERPVILFASKLIERKRPLDTIEAYKQLSPDGRAEPDAQLLLVGDGPLREAVQEAAAETGWSSIRIPGFCNQSRLPALYELCDVFVLPSRYETWGLVINEAMCAARPVVATTGCGAARDLIQHGETGFVFEAGDVSALAEHLATLTEDRSQARSMGASARLRVQGNDLATACDGIVTAVLEVCSS
jgi:glycosyltransferase involved in cell wall biosynthesis